MGQKTYGKSSLLAAPSQGLRRCLNILERHQEEDDLPYTLADSLKCLADLVTYGVLGKAERLSDLAILHPVAAAHQEYSPPFGRKAVNGRPDPRLFNGIVHGLIIGNRHVILNRKYLILKAVQRHILPLPPDGINAPIPHSRVKISPRTINPVTRRLLHPICRESLLYQILDQILVLEIVQRIDTQRPVVKPEQRIYACCLHHKATKLTNARHIIKFFSTNLTRTEPKARAIPQQNLPVRGHIQSNSGKIITTVIIITVIICIFAAVKQ